jgi:diguanylate cyclase (GGDEF)-like protein/PAS domain S-box-containing protein
MLQTEQSPSSKRKARPPVLFWAFAGGATLCALVVIERMLSGLPVNWYQLTLLALLGALGGGLFGRSEIRLRLLNNRLQESEKRLQALYRNTPAMLHSLDADGRLVYVSQAWLDSLGYRRDQVIGRPFSDFIIAADPEEALRHHLQTLHEQGEIRDARYRLRGADGCEIEVALTEVAHSDQDEIRPESLAVLTDLTLQLAAEERVEKLAYCDSLTGLPNRALLNDRLLHAIAQARRDNRQVGVFFFDLDRFKTINDTLGHAFGDLVLRSVAQRLRKFIREGDTFARLGGDEFVIVQADPNQDPNFAILARRILETLGEPFKIGDRELYTTASIGVAVYPHDGDDPASLLKSADTAMYVAKSRGRSNFKFFSSEMSAEITAQAALEQRVLLAMHHDQLTLHYQPQVDLDTGRIVAVKALLRWRDEGNGEVPPAEIIRVAEASGLIYALNKWSIETAAAQATAWAAAGLPEMRMAVNLSSHYLRQGELVDTLEQILQRTGMPPGQLELELSEATLMKHIQETLPTLTDLQVRGINLSIDKFGTGGSSLIYLLHLPIQRIKIAPDFILDVTRNRDHATITEAIIAMAHRLGLKVTAVGVETNAQLEFLRRQGCTEVAGTFLSPPLPADEVARLLCSNVNLLASASHVRACQ